MTGRPGLCVAALSPREGAFTSRERAATRHGTVGPGQMPACQQACHSPGAFLMQPVSACAAGRGDQVGVIHWPGARVATRCKPQRPGPNGNPIDTDGAKDQVLGVACPTQQGVARTGQSGMCTSAGGHVHCTHTHEQRYAHGHVQPLKEHRRQTRGYQADTCIGTQLPMSRW